MIEPGALLLDESLSNRDAEFRIGIRDVIKQIQHDVGLTTVYLTHDEEEAMAVSGHIAVMNHAVFLQVGTPREIYRHPSSAFVASSIALSNLLPAKATAASGHAAVTMTDDTVEESLNTESCEVLVSVCPEEFVINSVESSVFLGTSLHYFLKTAVGQHIEVITDDTDTDEFEAGTEAWRHSNRRTWFATPLPRE